MKLCIHTDGACKGNPGPGGYGAVVRDITNGKQKKLKGFCPNTTNNKMELQGVIAAFDFVRKLKKQPKEIEVVTDSMYVINGMTKWILGWQRKNWKSADGGAVKNVEQWKELGEIRKQYTIKWTWVKGHSGDTFNEMADALANEAIASGK